MSTADTTNGIIAGLEMLAIGGVFVLIGVLTGAHRKKVAATYTTTQALVKKCRGIRNSDENGGNSSFRVVLEYTVGGITYETRKKSMGFMEGLVTLYYNPDNPKKIYTEEQAHGKHVASWYIIAGIVGVLALSVIVFVLTQTRKPDM